jgi:hypothetical protein
MSMMPTSPPPRRKPDPQGLQAAAAGAGLILPDTALLAFQQGRVLEAIKLIRAANPGLDLTRAKAVVQRMKAQAQSAAADVRDETTVAAKPLMQLQSRRPPTIEMGDRPGQLRWLLVVALLAAAAWLGFAGVF